MLYAKLIDGLVAEVTPLKRDMFGIRGSHEMSLEELKKHNICAAQEEHIPFNPATHREHIEWIFDSELEKVIGKKTILNKDLNLDIESVIKKYPEIAGSKYEEEEQKVISETLAPYIIEENNRNAENILKIKHNLNIKINFLYIVIFILMCLNLLNFFI